MGAGLVRAGSPPFFSPMKSTQPIQSKRGPGRPPLPNARGSMIPWRIQPKTLDAFRFLAFAANVPPGKLLDEMLAETNVRNHIRQNNRRK